MKWKAEESSEIMLNGGLKVSSCRMSRDTFSTFKVYTTAIKMRTFGGKKRIKKTLLSIKLKYLCNKVLWMDQSRNNEKSQGIPQQEAKMDS